MRSFLASSLHIPENVTRSHNIPLRNKVTSQAVGKSAQLFILEQMKKILRLI